MKALVLILFVFSCLSFQSCKKDKPEINEDTEIRIKSKSYFSSVEDSIPYRIYEYYYDSDLRLEKITLEEYVYESFEYNSNNQMENKYTFYYANDSLGWLLSDSTHYSYSEGKLCLEEISDFVPSLHQWNISYEYFGSLLKKKYKYDETGLLDLTVYEYSDDFCIMETTFEDSLETSIVQYTNYEYEGDLLTGYEVFSGSGTKAQIVALTYNDNGILIIEESKRGNHAIVKPLDYVIRYEYY